MRGKSHLSLARQLAWIGTLLIQVPFAPSARAQQAETVYEVTSPLWYEDVARFYRVSPDGRRGQYGSGPLGHLIDLEHRTELNLAAGDTLPPPGDSRYRLASGPDGLSALIRTADGRTDTLKRGLDGAWSVNFVAASPDGALLYVALAGTTAPQPSARHVPDADRDLDIYGFDPKTGTLRQVVNSPNDDCCPIVANGHLYWTHNEPDATIVVMPIDRSGNPGKPRTVARNGFLPKFSPDGRQIAYTKGAFRLADYGLDMDEWVVSLDSAGRPSSPKPLVVGYGEDMGATWSPDGKWLAFHSHRARTPYAVYDAPEHSDDLWIRRADNPSSEEIRLTDFGWEVGPPEWAPDSRQLLFESWEKTGAPAIAKPWIVEIDPATGRAAGLHRILLPAGVQGTKFEAWSPKGDEVALVQRTDGGHQAVWITSVDGKSARRLVDYQSYTFGGVTWTPDGREVWYSAIVDGRMQIFAVAAAGGTPRQITHDTANMIHPTISRDGRSLAATRVLWRKQLRRARLGS